MQLGGSWVGSANRAALPVKMEIRIRVSAQYRQMLCYYVCPTIRADSFHRKLKTLTHKQKRKNSVRRNFRECTIYIKAVVGLRTM
jgi:hypothetical protein